MITGVESGRGELDAVRFDMKDSDFLQDILPYSGLIYYLANVNNNLILIYPNEQRQKYVEIQPLIDFKDDIAEFAGFSYAEALAAKDFLQAADVQYTVNTNNDGQVKFSIPKCKEPVMESVIKAILSEEQTSEGRQYFESKNLYWLRTIDQAKKIITSNRPHFIGSEGGSKWMYVNRNAACIFDGTNLAHIARDDYDFKRTVMTSMLYELGGERAAIKVFSDDLAEMMFGNGIVSDITKNEALDVLGLSAIPDISRNADVVSEWLDKKDKNKKETESFYTIFRMSACRSISNDDVKSYKMTKKCKEFYKQMHEKNIGMFMEEREVEER